jgi:hypothetical protein
MTTENNVWRVRTEGNIMKIGSKQCVRIFTGGCNQPYKGRYWCPIKGWFSTEPCPFASRRECDTFRRMCGSL